MREKCNIKSFKVFCLPITNSKKEKLQKMINEYAKIYNFSAKYQPSLPDVPYRKILKPDGKLINISNPSKLYTKWIKSGIIKRKNVSALQAFNAIKDAWSNFKTSQNVDGGASLIKTPNIIKFENVEYKIIKTKNNNYGILLKSKNIYLPLKTGKYIELINHLENIINSENSGAIIYNLSDNSISIPIKLQRTNKMVKKNKIETIIGIDRGVNNTVVLAAIRKENKKIIGVKIVSGYNNKDKIRRINKIYNKRRHARKRTTNKIQNIQNTYGHEISNQIVEFAKKYSHPILVFEKLRSHKLFSKFKSWNYGDAKSKTDYKLRNIGLYSIEVDPKYTSQICHRCGAIGIRIKGTIHFGCPSCGLGFGSNPKGAIGQYNADVNAAINIALKGFSVLYEQKKDKVELSNVQPNENIIKPIPTVMNGIDGRNSIVKAIPYLDSVKTTPSKEMNNPMVNINQVSSAPENDISFLYKGNDKNVSRTNIEEKINSGEVL